MIFAMLTSALLDQETLNRAEFVALMDHGELPTNTGEDKPRTVQEILRQGSHADVTASDLRKNKETTDAEADGPDEPFGQTAGSAER